MIQADMLAYHAAGEPPQLGLPDVLVLTVYIRGLRDSLTERFCRIGTSEVTQLIANVSAIYSPELKVGFTPVSSNCHCS